MFSRVLCSATVCLALGGESFKAHDPHDPVVAKRVGQGSFENCFRRSAISSLDGGQFESHVLQWNTNAPDFNASSNSSWLNATVWLWLFGQTISNSNRSLINPPAASRTERPPARAMRPRVRLRAVLSTLDGSANPRLLQIPGGAAMTRMATALARRPVPAVGSAGIGRHPLAPAHIPPV